MIDRRELLVGSLAGLVAAACSDKQKPTTSANPTTPVPQKPSPKQILILGGQKQIRLVDDIGVPCL